MEYKYETHCHTAAVSLCARTQPKELVRLYDSLGYSGLVLTDHYSPMTFWKKRIFSPRKMSEFYLSAYRELKDYCGDAFSVLLGMELRHYATANDYLVYGVEEDWLLRQPNMLAWDERAMYRHVHAAGYLVYQAHPFRPFIRRCNPRYLDGVEIYNGHTPAAANAQAAAWAKEIGKPVLSGGDCHRPEGDSHGGIVTRRPIRSNADLLDVLRGQDYTLIPVSKEGP